ATELLDLCRLQREHLPVPDRGGDPPRRDPQGRSGGPRDGLLGRHRRMARGRGSRPPRRPRRPQPRPGHRRPPRRGLRRRPPGGGRPGAGVRLRARGGAAAARARRRRSRQDPAAPQLRPGVGRRRRPRGRRPLLRRQARLRDRLPAGRRGRAGRHRLRPRAARHAARVTTFRKTRFPHPDAALFEAAGLRWLAEVDGGARVAQVRHVEPGLLELERVDDGRAPPAAARAFGAGLARTHAAGAPGYGFVPGDTPLFMGRLALPAPDPAPRSWGEFYATERVLPYLRRAVEQGWIGGAGQRTIERVVERLTDGELDHTQPRSESTRLNSSHVKISYTVFCLK